jgi:hypothetical protein
MSRGWLIDQEESVVKLMVSQNAMPSILRSQIVMSNEDRMMLRRPPYAFTEQGVGFAFSKMDFGAIEMLARLEGMK